MKRFRKLKEFLNSGMPEDKCWEWPGYRNEDGYGVVACKIPTKSGGKKHQAFRAHRVSYELRCGPIPEGMLILHSCDNRLCCNPAHLRIGTHEDNMRDMSIRGRSYKSYGNTYRVRIPNDAVLKIIELHKAGNSYRKIIALTGVSKAQVSYIINRKSRVRVTCERSDSN